jgi:hypothetical protein
VHLVFSAPTLRASERAFYWYHRTIGPHGHESLEIPLTEKLERQLQTGTTLPIDVKISVTSDDGTPAVSAYHLRLSERQASSAGAAAKSAPRETCHA